MQRVVLVGSPRESGRCAHLAEEIFEACIEDCPEDGVSMLSVASLDIDPCIGCDRCKRASEVKCDDKIETPDLEDPLCPHELVRNSNACAHQCFMRDDMVEVRKHMDAADHLIVVAPLYFAGPPSQLKVIFDRLQPYFWSDIRSYTKKRRTFELHVVGEGGNPYGFAPLEGCARSALGVCGFQLDRVLDWTGRVDESGQISRDAEEHVGGTLHVA